MRFPKYVGLDVAKKPIGLCRARFAEDHTKSFFLYDPCSFVDNHGIFRADMALSLDVIYHLTEDKVYRAYMEHLFSAAEAFVIIYSCDFEDKQQGHVRCRKFSSWVDSHCPGWRLLKRIPNPSPYDPGGRTGSWSDFFIYRKEQPRSCAARADGSGRSRPLAC